MRFIRRFLVAASDVLVSLARRIAVTIGESAVLLAARRRRRDLLLAKSKLSRAATAEGLPFYVTTRRLVSRCSSTPRYVRIEATNQFESTASWAEVWMRIYSVILAAATAPLAPPSLTTGRGPAAASFAADGSLAPSGRYVARFIEIVVFTMLLALIALPAPARAQTITISSVTATPATVQPGQPVVFIATITANQYASNYIVLFSLHPPGASDTNTTQQWIPRNISGGRALDRTL